MPRVGTSSSQHHECSSACFRYPGFLGRRKGAHKAAERVQDGCPCSTAEDLKLGPTYNLSCCSYLRYSKLALTVVKFSIALGPRGSSARATQSGIVFKIIEGRPSYTLLLPPEKRLE